MGKADLKNDIKYFTETNIWISTIFISSENNMTSKAHRLRLTLTNNMDLRGSDNCVALSDLTIYYTWKNIKRAYRNNKFKISGITWDNEF